MIAKRIRYFISEVVSILKNFWDPGFFFPDVYLPLIVLAIYLGSFAWLHSSILSYPVGVNYFYANRSWQYILNLAVGTSLLSIAYFIFKKKDKITFKFTRENEEISRGDFLLLLFPLTPVIQYLINNNEILTVFDSLVIIGFFLLSSGFYIFVMPVLLSSISSPRTMRFLGLAFVYTIINMASLSSVRSWYEIGTLRVQWALFLSIFLVTWILYKFRKKELVWLIIVVGLVVNSAFQLWEVTNSADREYIPAPTNRIASLLDEQPVFTPSIYLLVYDAYVANETMLAYGFDNSLQEEYLEGLGFELYPHTYSIAAKTNETMSSVLNVSTGDGGFVRKSLSGDGEVQNALKALGYKTVGVFTSGSFFRGTQSAYDITYPESIPIPAGIVVKGILLGEFRFDLDFNLDYDKPLRAEFVDAKNNALNGSIEDPIFLYTHSNRPAHSQNSGVCRLNEVELFIDRLGEANLEMKSDVELILEHDPEAIIIVAGDHGPYLTKNCSVTSIDYDVSEISRKDIQDRNGTFLAIHWPTNDFKQYDEILILQDLFPAIFAYLHDNEVFLDLKIPPISDPFYSGVQVENGIILDGMNAGEPLYVMGE